MFRKTNKICGFSCFKNYEVVLFVATKAEVAAGLDIVEREKPKVCMNILLKPLHVNYFSR